jgi:hypothetical protein
MQHKRGPIHLSSDREAFYKRYDAAVAKLPSNLGGQVVMTTTGIDAKGTMTLYDKWGRVVAREDCDGNLTVGAKEAPKAQAPQKPAVRYATFKELNGAIDGIADGVHELIQGVETNILRISEAFDVRIKSIEGSAITKSLDAAAVDTMAEMAERLDRLESTLQEIADGGFRYRGYWRDGMKAKRGDAFTHDGSLWWAVRPTEDRPCNESMDWQVAVRKGRDTR